MFTRREKHITLFSPTALERHVGRPVRRHREQAFNSALQLLRTLFQNPPPPNPSARWSRKRRRKHRGLAGPRKPKAQIPNPQLQHPLNSQH